MQRPMQRGQGGPRGDRRQDREGVQTVGIDRIIEHAGVAKASLYNSFRSKEDLVGAYLRLQHDDTTERLTQAINQHHDPRERLLGDVLGGGRLVEDLGEADRDAAGEGGECDQPGPGGIRPAGSATL